MSGSPVRPTASFETFSLTAQESAAPVRERAATSPPAHTLLSALPPHGRNSGHLRKLSRDSSFLAEHLKKNGRSLKEIWSGVNQNRQAALSDDEIGVAPAFPRSCAVADPNDYSIEEIVAWHATASAGDGAVDIPAPEPFIAGADGTMALRVKGNERIFQVSAVLYERVTRYVCEIAKWDAELRPTILDLSSRFRENRVLISAILRYAKLMKYLPTSYEHALERVNIPSGDTPGFTPSRGSGNNEAMRICYLQEDEDGQKKIDGWVSRGQYDSLVKLGNENMGKDPEKRLTYSDIATEVGIPVELAKSALTSLNLDHRFVPGPFEVELVTPSLAEVLAARPFVAGRNGRMALRLVGRSKRDYITETDYSAAIDLALKNAALPREKCLTIHDISSKLGLGAGRSRHLISSVLRYAGVMQYIPDTYENLLREMNTQRKPTVAFQSGRNAMGEDDGKMEIRSGRTISWRISEDQYRSIVNLGEGNIRLDPAERLTPNEIAERIDGVSPSLVRAALHALNLSCKKVPRPTEVELANE